MQKLRHASSYSSLGAALLTTPPCLALSLSCAVGAVDAVGSAVDLGGLLAPNGPFAGITACGAVGCCGCTVGVAVWACLGAIGTLGLGATALGVLLRTPRL